MDEEPARNKSEAPGQAAGYVFQLRYALHKALERMRRDPTGAIAIEKYDDVAVINDGNIISVEQLKHVTQIEVDISDSSKALWRTLGNWSRLLSNGTVELTRADFCLVTNATVPSESALAFLCPDEAARNVGTALAILRNIALSSKNKATEEDRAIFMKLGELPQAAFLRSVFVVPNAPNLAGLTAEIEASLYPACEHQQLPEFRQELEGWWLERASTELSAGKGPVIPLIALDGKIAFLREKFKASTLQINVGDPEGDLAGLDGYVFVEQIRCVKASGARIKNAQKAFLKASAQRSKWLREAKIDPAELTRYDNDLQERWGTQCAIVTDELGIDADEDDKRKCGRGLLGWAEVQETPLKGASAQFLTGGSFHALADTVKVGWHPEFTKYFKPK